MFSLYYKPALFAAAFFSVFSISGACYGVTHLNSSATGMYSSGSPVMDIQWPLNNINLSQLQNLLTQNPGIGQFNIQFPNQTNWGVTPDGIGAMSSLLQQEAQAVGVDGKLPDLSFSSLAASAVKSGLPQLSINPNGDIKSQMDDVLRQVRYQSMNFSDMLPDWLKRIFLDVYDAVYSTFDFLGSKLAGFIGR